MKLKTKQITVTAIMLAICIISQFFKNLSVYITGPVINAALILTAIYAGLACGIILSIITPITSFFITGMPVMAAVPALFPCIIIGNVILVVMVALLRNKFGKTAGLPVSIGIGAILKALFMGFLISLLILPNMLPVKMQTDAPCTAIAVFCHTADYRTHWWRICSYHLCNIAKNIT